MVAVAAPSMRELDALAAIVDTLLEEKMAVLNDRYGPKPLSLDDLTTALMPYLFSENVPLHATLRTPESVAAVVKRLFTEATVGMPSAATRIFWDPFVEFLSQSHRRHVQRISQRPLDVFRYVANSGDIPQNIRHLTPVSSVATGDAQDRPFIVLRDEASRRWVDWRLSTWETVPAITLQLQTSVSGMPTSTAYIPAPFHRSVVSFASSCGSSLGFFERATGRLAFEVPVLSHQTVMSWMPRLGRLVCGSALGEISVYLPNGKCGPTMIQPHNGPIVLLGHLELVDALISAGSDGRLVITDAPTITELRSVVAVDGHITCGVVDGGHNLVVVGGSSPQPMLWNASLPPYCSGTFLSDTRQPHLHTITDIALHNESILSLDANGLLKVWDMRTMKCIDSLLPPLGEESRRVSTFSHILGLGDGRGFTVTSSEGAFTLAVETRAPTDYAPKADEVPIEFFDVLRGQFIVTLSRCNVRLWSCRTGELQGKYAVGVQPTCLSVHDELSLVLVGDGNGCVTWVDTRAVLFRESSLIHGLTQQVHTKPITCMVCCGQLLVVGSAVGVAVMDVKQPLSKPSVVPGIDGAATAELFADHHSAALMSPGRRLYVVEAAEAEFAIDDFREYDVNVSLRSTVEESASTAFCFFGSPSTICVADGLSISLVSIVGIRTRRLLSFSSVHSAPVSLSFEMANGKSVLVSLEEDGTCVIYSVTDLLPLIAKCGTKAFLDPSKAPTVHACFSAPSNHRMAILPVLSVCCFGSNDGGCTVFRYDGVRIGDLDMHGGEGTTMSWLPIASKTRRGSNIVFRVNFDASTAPQAGQSAKHHIRMRHHPVVGAPHQHPESRRPHLQSVMDPLSRLPFNDRLVALTTERSTAKVVAVKGERSSRTLPPIELSDAHWTTDAKAKPATRDNMKVLTDMRLLTQGLLPTTAMVREATNLTRRFGSPERSRSSRTMHNNKHRLCPLSLPPRSQSTPLLGVAGTSSHFVEHTEVTHSDNDHLAAVEQFFYIA